jgi:hypothetical protein
MRRTEIELNSGFGPSLKNTMNQRFLISLEQAIVFDWRSAIESAQNIPKCSLI